MIIKFDQPDSKRFANWKGGGVNICVIETSLSPEQIRERLEPYVFVKARQLAKWMIGRYEYIGDTQRQ